MNEPDKDREETASSMEDTKPAKPSILPVEEETVLHTPLKTVADETVPNVTMAQAMSSGEVTVLPSAKPPEAAVEELVADKPLALVIEDDPDAAFIFRRAMEANGCDVTVIMRGDDAQEALKTLRPVVILLDLHLPAVSGVELLRQIRDNDEMQDTRVILLTADHATADMIEASADMVLLKPATYSQVRDLVGRIMRR